MGCEGGKEGAISQGGGVGVNIYKELVINNWQGGGLQNGKSVGPKLVCHFLSPPPRPGKTFLCPTIFTGVEIFCASL